MKSLISSSNRGILTVLLIPLVFLAGCSHLKDSAVVAEPLAAKNVRLAVYPLTNISGTKVPLKEIRKLLIERIQGPGVDIMSDAVLEKFMARHRIRYVAGLSAYESEPFKDETGTDAVLIASVVLYDERYPSKIALTARLVSTGKRPVVLWSDSIGLAGDDSPGILGLGLIEDPKKLLDKAVRYLSRSLTDYLAREGARVRGVEEGSARDAGKEVSVQTPSAVSAWSVKDLFGSVRPRSYYVAPFLEAHKRYSVVVMPFLNKSGRRNANDAVMLEFIRQLSGMKNFTVLDPGMLRQEMLESRIIMLDSISVADADIIFSRLDADLLLTGTVNEYYDYDSSFGTSKVGFSVFLIEKKGRRLVFASESSNTGDDQITFFELGKIRTAHALASRMIGVTLQRLSEGIKTGT
jgi:TolB-like protein